MLISSLFFYKDFFDFSAAKKMMFFESPTQKEEAETLLPQVSSMLDKLAKKNIIHKKKASNLKSKLQKHVSSL